MKNVTVPCIMCFTEDGKPSDTLYTLPLNDDGLFKLICEKSHETTILLQQQKFEILFERGALALLDGYPDAAATRFAVALERFYEVYAKVIFLKYNMRSEEFSLMWRNMPNHSERQYGAFLAAYHLDKSSHIGVNLPALIEESWITFRNKVTHQGYIPTHEEASKHGNRVFNFVRELTFHIDKHYSQEKRKIITEYLANISKLITKENTQIATISHPTLLQFTCTSDSTLDFDEAITELSKSKFRRS